MGGSAVQKIVKEKFVELSGRQFSNGDIMRILGHGQRHAFKDINQKIVKVLCDCAILLLSLKSDLNDIDLEFVNKHGEQLTYIQKIAVLINSVCDGKEKWKFLKYVTGSSSENLVADISSRTSIEVLSYLRAVVKNQSAKRLNDDHSDDKKKRRKTKNA